MSHRAHSNKVAITRIASGLIVSAGLILNSNGFSQAADFRTVKKTYVSATGKSITKTVPIRTAMSVPNLAKTQELTSQAKHVVKTAAVTKVTKVAKSPQIAPKVAKAKAIAGKKVAVQKTAAKISQAKASPATLKKMASKGISPRVKIPVQAARPAVTSGYPAAHQQAEKLIASGRTGEAYYLLRRSISYYPNDTVLRQDLTKLDVLLSKQALNSGKFEAAASGAREALYLSPSSVEGKTVLEESLHKLGINPKDHNQRLKLADALAQAGKNNDATVEYWQSLQLKPTAQGHIGFANMALAANQISQAKSEYQKAAELDPHSHTAFKKLGLLRKQQGDIVGANSDLSRAVLLNNNDKEASAALIDLWEKQTQTYPGLASTHLGLARAHQISGNLSAAQASYREVVRLDPNHPNLPAARQSFKLALARQESKKFIESARNFESDNNLQQAYASTAQALNLTPNDVTARLYQGHLLEKMGELDAARSAYQTILKVDPKNEFAKQALAAVPTAMAMSLPVATAAETAVQAYQQPLIPPTPELDHVGSIATLIKQVRGAAVKDMTAHGAAEDIAQAVQQKLSKTPDIVQMIKEAIKAEPILGAGAPAGMATAAEALDAVKGGSSPAGPPAAAPVQIPASEPKEDLQWSDNISSASALAAQAISMAKANKTPGKVKDISPAKAPATPVKTTPSKKSQTKPTYTSYAKSGAPTAPDLVPQPIGPTTAPQYAPPFTRQASQQPATTAQSPDLQYAPQPAAQFTQPATQLAQASAFNPAFAIGSGADTSSLGLRPAFQQNLPRANTAGAYTKAIQSPDTNNVHLELKGVQRQGNEIVLNVVLKNNSLSQLPITGNAKCLIRTVGKPDGKAKLRFLQTSVSPQNEAHGTITVPGTKLDPTSDFIVRGLLPGAAANKDLHVTTAIAQR